MVNGYPSSLLLAPPRAARRRRLQGEELVMCLASKVEQICVHEYSAVRSRCGWVY